MEIDLRKCPNEPFHPLATASEMVPMQRGVAGRYKEHPNEFYIHPESEGEFELTFAHEGHKDRIVHVKVADGMVMCEGENIQINDGTFVVAMEKEE